MNSYLLSHSRHSQALLAIPLVGLYMGGALVVKTLEQGRAKPALP